MHDRNGTPLKEGDLVLVPMRITQLSAAPDFCNVALASLYGRNPDGQKETVSAVNTGIVVLFERPK
jgi:hypothetical protein